MYLLLCSALAVVVLTTVWWLRGRKQGYSTEKWLRDFHKDVLETVPSPSCWPAPPSATERPLYLASTQPRVLVCPKFLSDEECDHLVRIASKKLKPEPSGQYLGVNNIELFNSEDAASYEAADLHLMKNVEERLATITGIPPHADESGLVFQFNPPVDVSTPSDKRRCNPMGLHLDTNKGMIERACTVILYLNDTPQGKGGETVFPCTRAADDWVRDSARSLHMFSFTHTRNAGSGHSMPAEVLIDAANRLVGHPGVQRNGLAVRPEKGLAVLFYSRSQDGAVDPFSWHGGAMVEPGGVGKWSLQKFKAIPKGHRQDMGTYMSSRYVVDNGAAGGYTFPIKDLPRDKYPYFR